MADADGGLPEGAPPPAVGTPDTNELTDAFGVFVTPSATAGGDGTKLHPFASIERVKDLKLRVYVCAGTYAESLTLVNAVSVIGSLGCDGGVWTTGGGRSVLTAPTSPAIAPNSIALIAENATMLTVAKSKLTSAKAFDGVDGTEGVQLTLGATANGGSGAASGGPFSPAPPGFAIPFNGGGGGWRRGLCRRGRA